MYIPTYIHIYIYTHTKKTQAISESIPQCLPPQQPVLVAQIPGTADARGVNAPEGRVADEFAVSVHPNRASLPVQA